MVKTNRPTNARTQKEQPMSHKPLFKVTVFKPTDLNRPWAVVSVFAFGESMSQPDDMPDTLWEACLDSAKWFRTADDAATACRLDDFYHGLVLVKTDAETGDLACSPWEVAP
jgi:hypothetical protein